MTAAEAAMVAVPSRNAQGRTGPSGMVMPLTMAMAPEYQVTSSYSMLMRALRCESFRIR